MPGHKTRRLLIGAAATALLLTSCNRTTEIGEVRNPNIVINRDGAASTILGGKVFWAFGDTFAPGGGVRSSGAYADRANPTRVTDTLVGRRPHQLVPFTAAEEADNRNATDGSQWVIWPSSIINTSPDRALIFSTKFHATPEGWIDGSLVISEITAGSTVSTRIAEPLTAPGSNYATGIYARDGYIYLHDCGGVNLAPELGDGLLGNLPILRDIDVINPTPGKCRLARVPIAKATDGTAYRYWSGAAWSPTQASAVATVPGSNSGLSVAWSPKMAKYVALSSPGLSKDLEMSTASRPEGPWTKPKVVFTAETGIYAMRIHPHLSTTDLATMGVSYFRQDQPDKVGGVVLVDFTPA